MEKVFKHETFGEARISTVKGFSILTMDDIMVQQSDTDAFMKWLCNEVLPEVNPKKVCDNKPVADKMAIEKVKKINYIDITEEEYPHLQGIYTIRDWCLREGIEISRRRKAKCLGLRATWRSRVNSYPVYRIENKKYGKLNAYDIAMLEDIEKKKMNKYKI